MNTNKHRFLSAKPWILAAALAGSWSLFSGCGALISTADLTQAERAVESAADVDADVWAVYEFVSATEYLLKAREEWAHSDFGRAHDYARLARQFADAATERATTNPDRGAPSIESVF